MAEKNNEILKPINEKITHSRTVLIIAVTVMLVLIIVVGIFTMKTSYVYINSKIGYQETHTFDSNGKPESWEIECRGSTEIQNNYFSQYALINDYDGCKAELNQDKNYFKLTIDFNKAPDEIYDVLNFPHCEDEFVDREKSDCVLSSLIRFKKFFGIKIYTGRI